MSYQGWHFESRWLGVHLMSPREYVNVRIWRVSIQVVRPY